jgi:hypothetical protein
VKINTQFNQDGTAQGHWTDAIPLCDLGRLESPGRRRETPATNWTALERGWCVGDKEFREELLAQMHEGCADHYGEE